MNQTDSIHRALKRLIRSRGLTYADAAPVLGLSEASIKRLFSRRAFSLQRLERLCDWLGVDVGELVRLSREQDPLTTELTTEQERELLRDFGTLLLAYLLLNDWSIEEILDTYDMSRPELLRRMFRLQALGMVEVLPFDRVRLKTARNFSWRKGGPIQKFFTDRVLAEFLDSRFEQPDERMSFVGGMLSSESLHYLQQKIGDLAREFDRRLEADLALPAEERHGSSLLVAFRPWEFSEFARFRKTPDGEENHA